jgi:hypothetical protein
MVTRRIPDPKIVGSIPTGVSFFCSFFWENIQRARSCNHLHHLSLRTRFFDPCFWRSPQPERFSQKVQLRPHVSRQDRQKSSPDIFANSLSFVRSSKTEETPHPREQQPVLGSSSEVVQWLVFPPVTRETRVRFPALECFLLAKRQVVFFCFF